MIYLLDTNIIIHIMNFPHSKVLKKFQKYSPTDLYISSISEAELWFGVRKSAKVAENTERLGDVLKYIQEQPFESSHAYAYGVLRQKLEQNGKVIGPNDLLIAAQALAMNATLVTDNVKEFSQIEDLRIENWLHAT